MKISVTDDGVSIIPQTPQDTAFLASKLSVENDGDVVRFTFRTNGSRSDKRVSGFHSQHGKGARLVSDEPTVNDESDCS